MIGRVCCTRYFGLILFSLFGIFEVSLYSEKIYISEGSFILLSDIFQALVLFH